MENKNSAKSEFEAALKKLRDGATSVSPVSSAHYALLAMQSQGTDVVTEAEELLSLVADRFSHLHISANEFGIVRGIFDYWNGLIGANGHVCVRMPDVLISPSSALRDIDREKMAREIRGRAKGYSRIAAFALLVLGVGITTAFCVVVKLVLFGPEHGALATTDELAHLDYDFRRSTSPDSARNSDTVAKLEQSIKTSMPAQGDLPREVSDGLREVQLQLSDCTVRYPAVERTIDTLHDIEGMFGKAAIVEYYSQWIRNGFGIAILTLWMFVSMMFYFRAKRDSDRLEGLAELVEIGLGSDLLVTSLVGAPRDKERPKATRRIPDR